MKDMHEIREMLMDELINTADGNKLTVDKLKVIDMLTHSIKSIDTIEAMQDSGYSGADHYYPDHNRNYEHRIDRGRSYARRGDGRYSRNEETDSIMTHLDMMLDEARTDKEREAIMKFMDTMKRM